MTTGRRSLAEMRAAWTDPNAGKTNNGGNFPRPYPFWKMKPGERCVIRWIPDLDESNPRGFLVEYIFNTLTINGRKQRVTSRTLWNEECPIAKLSAEFYAAGDEENGRKYWKQREYRGQALIIEDPLGGDERTGEPYEGTVQPVFIGKQIMDNIKEAFASDELESYPDGIGGEDDPEDTWGYDFIIKLSMNGTFRSYVVGTKFANRSRPLTATEVELVQEARKDLTAAFIPEMPTYEHVQGLLSADLNGVDGDDEEKFETTPRSAAAKSTESTPPRRTAPATSTVQEDTSDSMEQGGEDLLAQIKQRRAAKARQED